MVLIWSSPKCSKCLRESNSPEDGTRRSIIFLSKTKTIKEIEGHYFERYSQVLSKKEYRNSTKSPYERELYINKAANPATAAITPVLRFSVTDIAADVGLVLAELLVPEEAAELLPGAVGVADKEGSVVLPLGFNAPLTPLENGPGPTVAAAPTVPRPPVDC